MLGAYGAMSAAAWRAAFGGGSPLAEPSAALQITADALSDETLLPRPVEATAPALAADYRVPSLGGRDTDTTDRSEAAGSSSRMSQRGRLIAVSLWPAGADPGDPIAERAAGRLLRPHAHGGAILKLLDQVAYACASRYSDHYDVTLSVDQVVFR